MVHIPSSYRYDFWLQQSCDQMVEISCLLPNGVFIALEVNKDATLHEIKEDLWEEATKYPLVCNLQDSSSYIFSCVNALAEKERLIDEAKRLCDVRPFNSVLRVVERSQESDENKLLQQQISHLIGRGLHEFDELKNPEVNYFRWKMKLLADEVASQRSKKSWLEKLCCQFPPRLAPQTNLPPTVTSKLKDGNLLIYIIFRPIHSNQHVTKKMNVSHSIKPSELVEQALQKFLKNHPISRENPLQYCLKVKGQEEYLVGNYPIVSFVYIQESLANDSEPSLVIVSLDSVPVDGGYDVVTNSADELKDSGNSTLTLRKKGKLSSSWQMDHLFTFQVSAVARLNCDFNDNRTVDVCVQAGLFHSGKALCESQKTMEKTVNKDGTVAWDEDLQFDIKVSNIPRMARLCIVLFEICKSSKGLKTKKIKDQKQEMYINPIGWVNTPVFDFKNQLKTGAMTLYMWSYAEDSQTDSDLFHPLGTVTTNPNVDHSTTLTILFHKYHAENTVIYPPFEKILETSKQLNADKNCELERTSVTFEQIKALSERDPLHEMHEQEKKDVWANRYLILREVPEMLPKLLDCVEWNNHHQVCEAMALLDKWPLLPPEKALELLDYAYADQAVRSFAVRCLSRVTDDDLSLFLLQLVQALKHENYLHCDLVEYLLRRALNNQKIGHFLFWHLRSEMHVPSVWVRFGLMLEAYCRGDVDHMRMLCRQVTLLSKFKSYAEEVRLKKDKDKARFWLIETLSQAHIREYLNGVLNPLDPTYRFKNVRVERCKVMDSKMRPLWLVMENFDSLGDDVYLLFKNGDDLRQDMLTLQMIRLMDRLWKNEGLDLRMNPYGCISTDNRVGLIEVVLNAETIANIQKEKGMFSATSAFKKGSLLAWLKDHNPSEVSLNKAIEEFTYSCAGYCVATYVLGIADRHSDNIMVKRTGQLFHIDFGHILGHFKEKFGFRRERVPFVLTHDFVYVINKGQTVKKERGNQPKKFELFQKRCEDAFLILRKHGNLILSLFAMMISTGLPELSSEQDLSYLRETLVLDLSESDARAHFRSKFDEALSNSWKTSLHWASHNMAKNNKV